VEFEMQILPEDIINEIIYFTSSQSLIEAYNAKFVSLSYKELISILSDKIGIDVRDYTLDGIKAIIKLDYIIFLLTTLGKMYHTGFGFQWELEIYKDEENGELCKFIKDYAIKEEDEMAIFNTDTVKRLAKMIIPFRTVVLKYPKNYWIEKCDTEWYNKESTWWKNCKVTNKLLPFLNSRSYIIVNDPYMQISISAEKKGSSLTVDDILFATRGLAYDDTRTVADDEGYRVLCITEDTLTLEPVMDNYST
jgi:hypothetical protein